MPAPLPPPTPYRSPEEKRADIIRIQMRRTDVAGLILQRVPIHQIAHQMKCSVRTIRRDRLKLLEAWSREAGTRIDLQVGRELAALDQDEFALRLDMAAETNKVTRLKFYDRIAKIQESRRALLGLDAASKIGIKFEGALEATAEIRDRAFYQQALADPDMRREVLARWRAVTGMLPAPDRHATTVPNGKATSDTTVPPPVVVPNGAAHVP